MISLSRILVLSTFLVLTCHHASAQGTWNGYVVTRTAFEYCPGPTPADPNALCLAFNQRWDSGRRQHINYAYRINAETGEIKQWLYMLNKEYIDGDTVCFAARFMDENDNDLFVFYERWGINSRSDRGQNYVDAVPPELWRKTRTLWKGFRVCNKGDDSIWGPIIVVAMGACAAIAPPAAGYCGAAGAAALDATYGSRPGEN